MPSNTEIVENVLVIKYKYVVLTPFTFSDQIVLAVLQYMLMSAQFTLHFIILTVIRCSHCLISSHDLGPSAYFSSDVNVSWTFDVIVRTGCCGWGESACFRSNQHSTFKNLRLSDPTDWCSNYPIC